MAANQHDLKRQIRRFVSKTSVETKCTINGKKIDNQTRVQECD